MISVVTAVYTITGITIIATSLIAKWMEEQCTDVVKKGRKNERFNKQTVAIRTVKEDKQRNSWNN